MLISHLMEKLGEIQAARGDIPIYTHDDTAGFGDPEYVRLEEVDITAVKIIDPFNNAEVWVVCVG